MKRNHRWRPSLCCASFILLLSQESFQVHAVHARHPREANRQTQSALHQELAVTSTTPGFQPTQAATKKVHRALVSSLSTNPGSPAATKERASASSLSNTPPSGLTPTATHDKEDCTCKEKPHQVLHHGEHSGVAVAVGVLHRKHNASTSPATSTSPVPPTTPAPPTSPPPPACQVTRVSVQQDHFGRGTLALGDVTAAYGGGALSEQQKDAVMLTPVGETSFMCMDDRVVEPSLVTPGGDIGEFILALSAFLQERGPTSGDGLPTQQEVELIFTKYVATLPLSRPFIHCTDDSALRHLQDELPLESLDLQKPSKHALKLGLLQKLSEVENHGDSHIRLMLKEPEWFQLNRLLVPMVLRVFYSKLWEQNMDTASPLHEKPKLRLVMLSGQSDPQAFFEVLSGGLCPNASVAPMLTPHKDNRALLISHLDAVSLRRKEFATFFANIANVGPRKIDAQRMHRRLERHGWLALETTGSRMAMGLPFFTLSYN